MKTLSKKLLSLMLAVVLLVSVVPFQAMAAEGDPTYYISVANVPKTVGDAEGWVEGQNYTVYPVTIGEGETVSLKTVAGDEPSWAAGVNGWTISTPAYAGQVFSWDMTFTAGDFDEDGYVGVYPANMPATEEPTTPPATEEPTTPPATEKPTEPTEPAAEEISLMVGDKEYATVKIVDGKVGVLPTAPLKDGYKFTYWYANSNGTGNTLYTGMPVSEVDTDRTYHASFKTSDDDGLGDLTVYAKFYVGSKLKDTVKLYTAKDLQNGTNAFDWLTANKDRTHDAIFSRVDTDDYEWEERYYYDYEGKEPLSEQDLIMNGDKSVVVKVYSKHEANVLLYVHRKVSSAAENIYEMGGYVKGDVVSRDAVLSLVKKHYTGSKMTIQGLYTDEAWSQLKNGEKPTAANGITVDSNGTVKIHVLLTNANSNSNADSSNPKTGDTIFMTVTVMAVSAIALAGAYILNKKRMVK